MNAREGRRAPNGGRELVPVIMSSDDLGRTSLASLYAATRDTASGLGLDISGWPEDLNGYLDGVVPCRRRIVRTDDDGDLHQFAVVDVGGHDLLVGVGSRRQMNLAQSRSGNLATEVILEVLRTPSPEDPDEPLYGVVTAYELHRVWRTLHAATAVHQHAKDWQLVLRSGSDRLDYGAPGTDLLALINAYQSAAGADTLVIGGSNRKRIAFEGGVHRYALGQVHPAVRVNLRTRELSYDPDVVRVLRLVARDVVAGSTWKEAAEAYADQIPARRATEERDVFVGESRPGPRPRTREERNRRRRLRGLEPLPERYLEDGSPNPDWRPLMIADLDDPASQLRTLFLRGPSVPVKDAVSVRRRIDQDLDGIAPSDATLEFLTTGIYRRLVKDHDRSN